MSNPNEYEELFGIGGEDIDAGEMDNDTDGETDKKGENCRKYAEPGTGRAAAGDEEVDEDETGDSANSCDEDGNGDCADDFGNAGKKAQSMEERAKFAAARRKAQTQEAVERAIREEQSCAKTKWNEFFAAAGLRNPLDGNAPITNLEEYSAYKAQYEARLRENSLKADTLTPQDAKKADSETEAMNTARRTIESTEAAEKRSRKESFNVKMREELKAIGELDPAVTSVEDILKSPRGKEFYSLVQAGHSYVDAFKLANFDRIQRTGQAAAQQQALNRTKSKDHLTSTSQRGAGAVTVPPEELNLYRALVPDHSAAEIQRHYSSYMKK